MIVITHTLWPEGFGKYWQRFHGSIRGVRSMKQAAYAVGDVPPRYPVPSIVGPVIIGPACVQVFDASTPMPRLLRIWWNLLRFPDRATDHYYNRGL